jgi:periplasmic protein TonB
MKRLSLAVAILGWSSVCFAQTPPATDAAPLIPSATQPLAAATVSPVGAAHTDSCSSSIMSPVAIRQPNTVQPIVLSFAIAADGSIKSAEIKQSSGYTELDEAALTCAKERWHFKPAMKDGQPIESTKEVRIRFGLSPR